MSDTPRTEINLIVDRFLYWKLPQTFSPDCGISFDGRKPDEWNKSKGWPVGTNLFTADEAKQMFQHCLAGSALGNGLLHLAVKELEAQLATERKAREAEEQSHIETESAHVMVNKELYERAIAAESKLASVEHSEYPA